MNEPSHLKLAIINRGRVMIVDEPVPNHPFAIAEVASGCALLHNSSRRAIHFQLRHPDDGRVVMVMEHGAKTFQAAQGYRHG